MTDNIELPPLTEAQLMTGHHAMLQEYARDAILADRARQAPAPVEAPHLAPRNRLEALRKLLRREPTLAEVTAIQKAVCSTPVGEVPAERHDELSREAGGSIALDWITKDRDMLTMSLSKDGTLHWAIHRAGPAGSGKAQLNEACFRLLDNLLDDCEAAASPAPAARIDDDCIASVVAARRGSPAPAASKGAEAEFGDHNRPMTDDELQDFCIACSFDQDDYTVDVIRNVERRMLGQPLFQCSVMSNAEMDAAPSEPEAQKAVALTHEEIAAAGLGLEYVHGVLRWAACGYVHTPERIAALHTAYRIVDKLVNAPSPAASTAECATCGQVGIDSCGEDCERVSSPAASMEVQGQWISPLDEMPPPLTTIPTLSREKRSTTGWAHSYGSWSDDPDDNSRPDSKMFRERVELWCKLPPLPPRPPKGPYRALTAKNGWRLGEGRG